MSNFETAVKSPCAFDVVSYT